MKNMQEITWQNIDIEDVEKRMHTFEDQVEDSVSQESDNSQENKV